ncbi:MULTISPECIES: hypothetical protein [Streptomyces]|uniref:hypothetical protein n=1 Tax=Streptomyces TaxID=1883 RepID=UPI00163C1121|nr:hypothetical protein [Streptomyces sp. WAC 01325]
MSGRVKGGRLAHSIPAADEAAPAAEALAAEESAAEAIDAPNPRSQYEALPGAGSFHIGRRGPLITAMGKRLVAEGCGRARARPPTSGHNLLRGALATVPRP